MKYVSPGYLRSMSHYLPSIIFLIIIAVIAYSFIGGILLATFFVILSMIIWNFFFPYPEEEYELTQKEVVIRQKEKIIKIPYRDIKKIIFRSFRRVPLYYSPKIGLRNTFGYAAITIKHGGKSTELAFEKEKLKSAESFFKEIKKHVGDKAKDWRGGDTDWKKVIIYFVLTWVIIIIAGLLVNLGFIVLALFFMPIWAVVWFLILNSLGKFYKE